jgi:hypothetical protein
MFNYVCSLKVSESQIISPNQWTIVKFPYNTESSDEYGMHETPAGVTNWKTDARSGLITPIAPGWGIMAGMAQFTDGEDATEFRTQFIRDPLNPDVAGDTTATTHWATSPGGDYFATSWPIYFRPEFPMAFRVCHNASSSLALSLAEFKVLI